MCKAKVDLGFLIDGSGSIEGQGRGNFKKVLDFVVRMIKEFEVSQSGTHIGAVLFDHRASVTLRFDQFYDQRSIVQKIQNVQYPGGGTSTGAALKLALSGLYTPSKRQKIIPKILIILTDGQSQDKVTDPAQKLRDFGVTIFSVGIGKGAKISELNDMATDPDSEHVFTADFNNLNTIVRAIKDKACQGMCVCTNILINISPTKGQCPKRKLF